MTNSVFSRQTSDYYIHKPHLTASEPLKWYNPSDLSNQVAYNNIAPLTFSLTTAITDM